MAEHPRPCVRCGQSPAFPLEADCSVGPALRADYPDPTAVFCRACLAEFRMRAVQSAMVQDFDDLRTLEASVEKSLREEKEQVEVEPKLTFGQLVADKVATFGGSWAFIGLFGLALAIWIAYNAISGARFDPFPFILLNLLLSCLAAIQAPVIMMSQNRHEARDRSRDESDYQTNLKAEIEIRVLHEKVDHLLSRQMRRLMEVQEIQIEMLRELRRD